MNDKWNWRFMNMAKEIASWSKDPSTKVGAVAVGSKKQILSMGFNGFPRGVNDTIERLTDKETKYSFVVHAEQNCIYNATLNGVSLAGADLYVYGLPVCKDCAKGVVQVGVKSVYFCSPVTSDKWKDSTSFSQAMFSEAGIEYNALHEPSARLSTLSQLKLKCHHLGPESFEEQ